MWQLADGEGGCPRGQRGSAEQLPGRGGTGPLPTSHPPSRRHRTCPAPRPRRRPGSPRALALLPFRVVVATRRGATTNARLISRRKPLPCMPREARRVRTASERSQKKKSLLRMGRCAVDGGWSKRRPAPPLWVGRVRPRRDCPLCGARGPRRTLLLFSKPKQMGPNLGLKEMRKITKDLAQGHSQEVEEGPQLQASTEEGGASKHPQLSPSCQSLHLHTPQEPFLRAGTDL